MSQRQLLSTSYIGKQATDNVYLTGNQKLLNADLRQESELKQNRLLNTIVLAAVLMALWFIMSQKTEPKFLMLGAASSILIAAFCSRILIMKGAVSGREYSLLSFNPFKMAAYFCWLLVQVIKSALYVSRIVLSDRSLVEPSIAWFRADYDSPFARALLANSITLTPGTITIDITDDGIYSVHALTNELREGLLDGSMQARVAKTFGEEIEFRALSAEEIPETARIETDIVTNRYIGRRKAR